MQGAREHAADVRNEAIQIDIGGTLVARADAKISGFDSGFILGDAVWEALAARDVRRVRDGSQRAPRGSDGNA